MAARDVTYEVGGTILIINWWTHVAQDVRKEHFTAIGHGGDDETMAVYPDGYRSCCSDSLYL